MLVRAALSAFTARAELSRALELPAEDVSPTASHALYDLDVLAILVLVLEA